MAGEWRRRQRRAKSVPGSVWVVLGGLVLLVALITLFAVRGVRIADLRGHLASAEQAYQAAVSERTALDHRFALRDDLSVIEDEARRQLGWILPGEIRVVFLNRAEEME